MDILNHIELIIVVNPRVQPFFKCNNKHTTNTGKTRYNEHCYNEEECWVPTSLLLSSFPWIECWNRSVCVHVYPIEDTLNLL